MKKKDPKYPITPAKNCLYCFWYNANAVACDNPKAAMIATFHQNESRDCVLIRYDKTENPEVPDAGFAQKFCLGKKCPYYFESKRLCTRPSLCPYKEDTLNVFTNIQLKEEEQDKPNSN